MSQIKYIPDILKSLKEDGFKLQSILFSKDDYTYKKAIKILENLGLKTDVDEKENTYRFRQINPIKGSIYRTKVLNDGISLVLMKKSIKGGKIIQKPYKYELSKSDKKDKKMKVELFNKNGELLDTVHFGAKGMSDFTKHKDEERRIRYIKRAGKITDKEGNLTRNDPYSANFWSMRILWQYDPKTDDKYLK
jgi:hypothetical protein